MSRLRWRTTFLPNSIFHRLRLLLAAVFFLGTLIAIAAIWLFSNTAATESYDRILVSSATQIIETVSVERDRLTVLPPDSAFETLAQSRNDRFFFAVRGPGGQLLTGEPSLRVAPGLNPTPEPILGYREMDGETMRTVTVFRLVASPTTNGWCSVTVAQSLNARSAFVIHLMLRIGALVIFIAGLGFFASLEAVKRALRPFDHIGRALAHRRVHDTGPLQVESPRETQALIETINAAFRRLDERMNKLQDFARIAAHQIRTPLSALGAQTELLLYDDNPKARRARIKKMRAHTSKLSRLTNQLLGQAMVSYRTERVPPAKVDLVGLARQVLHDAIPESFDRDLAVEFATEVPAAFIDGDKVTMREALLNLVSNAVEHGAGSLLRVAIETDGNAIMVRIADDGPGIASEDWESALKPFHLPRGDGEGAGLGLSIAAAVIEAHHGSMTASTTTDGLFEIAVRLPRADAAEVSA